MSLRFSLSLIIVSAWLLFSPTMTPAQQDDSTVITGVNVDPPPKQFNLGDALGNILKGIADAIGTKPQPNVNDQNTGPGIPESPDKTTWVADTLNTAAPVLKNCAGPTLPNGKKVRDYIDPKTHSHWFFEGDSASWYGYNKSKGQWSSYGQVYPGSIEGKPSDSWYK